MVTLTGTVISGARTPATAGNTAGVRHPGTLFAADHTPGQPGAEVSGGELTVPVRAGAATSATPAVMVHLRTETLSLSALRALSVFAQVAASADDNHGQAGLAGIDIVV